MEIKAVAKNIKSTPKKARIPADVVRGMFVEEALPILKYMPKKAALDIYKVVNSARANAVNNFNINPANLIIWEIRVDEGMKLRRGRPHARGSIRPFVRRFSTVSVTLKDITNMGDSKKNVARKETEAKETKTTKAELKNEIQDAEVVEVKKPAKKTTTKKAAAPKKAVKAKKVA